VSGVNLFTVELQHDDDDPPGYACDFVRLAPLVGGEQIALNVGAMPPGESLCPYHYESGEEEWLVVLSGTVFVRTPEGEREVGPWDCVFFPAGEAGGHKITNRSSEPARIFIWSNRSHPATTIYPDSNKVGAWPPGKLFKLDAAVDYYEGETSADASPSGSS
jgi:uncharacterized cupin superfamily protein